MCRPARQERRTTQRCVHMETQAPSQRVCAGCGEAMRAECWHKCSKCKAWVHTHITCSKVHSVPSDEESHICESCFVGSKKQLGSPIPASSPGKIAAAGMLMSLAAGSGDDATRESSDSSMVIPPPPAESPPPWLMMRMACGSGSRTNFSPVSYTHLRAHET